MGEDWTCSLAIISWSDSCWKSGRWSFCDSRLHCWQQEVCAAASPWLPLCLEFSSNMSDKAVQMNFIKHYEGRWMKEDGQSCVIPYQREHFVFLSGGWVAGALLGTRGQLQDDITLQTKKPPSPPLFSLHWPPSLPGSTASCIFIHCINWLLNVSMPDSEFPG